MKKVLLISMLLSLSLLIIACSNESSGDSDEKDTYLSIGTTNTSSSLYAYYSGLSKSIEQQAPEIKLTIIETGATLDNITRLDNGQIDIGLGVMDGAYEAYEGMGEWEGKAQTKLRNLFTYTENALFYVVNLKSGVTEFQQLNGEKFNVGIRGSTTETQTNSIFNLLGIEPNVHSGDVADAVNAMKDGDIIGLTKVGVGSNPDATIMDLETAVDVRLLGYTEEEVAKIQEEYPWLRTTQIPMGVYDWQTAPITTIAMQVGNITTTELSEDIAYKITKAAFEEKKFQEESYQSLKDADFIDLTLQSSIPLHVGSIKYLEEQGIDVPDELIPEEYER